MANTADDDRSELLDDDKLEGSDFPPERPLAVDEYGTTAAQQRIQEPLEQRLLREEPELTFAPEDEVADEEGIQAVGDLVDPVAGVPETEGELADPTVDPTTRDVATELEAPRPTEEEAMHIRELPE